MLYKVHFGSCMKYRNEQAWKGSREINSPRKRGRCLGPWYQDGGSGCGEKRLFSVEYCRFWFPPKQAHCFREKKDLNMRLYLETTLRSMGVKVGGVRQPREGSQYRVNERAGYHCVQLGLNPMPISCPPEGEGGWGVYPPIPTYQLRATLRSSLNTAMLCRQGVLILRC